MLQSTVGAKSVTPVQETWESVTYEAYLENQGT